MSNKNLINTLSNRYFMSSKLRNILAIVAVLLTSILFTSFFEIIGGIYESSQQVELRKGGYSAHGVINNINEKEFVKLKEQSQLKELGYESYVGDVTNSDLISRRTESWYMDAIAQKLRFALITNGHKPVKENEISADSETLRLLGIPLKEGAKVSLELSVGDKIEKHNFVLSGWWKSDVIDSNGIIIVSEKYQSIRKEHNTQSKDGTALVMFSDSYNLENKINTLIKESGYTQGKKAADSMFAYANSGYQSLGDLKNIGTIGMCIAFVLLIIFTGYLLIHNIFQISMERDIQFFRLLQAIGLSPKQVKKIVERQGIYICMFGIPIGLYLGYIFGKAIVPRLFYDIYSTFKGTQILVRSNFFVFLFAAVFSIVTVKISLSKSHRILNNNFCIGSTIKHSSLKEKRSKKSRYGAGIIYMALRNTTRKLKRTVITVISLSLCFVIVNTVYTALKGMSFEAYVAGDLDSDFIVAHSDYFNLNYFMSLNSPSAKLIDTIKEQKGFLKGGKIYCDLNSFYIDDKETDEEELIYPANANLNGSYTACLYGLEDFPWSELKLIDGNMSEKKLNDGRHIFIGVETDEQGNIIPETYHFKVGDKIVLQKEVRTKGESKVKYIKKGYIVMGHVAQNYLTNTCRGSCNYNFYVPDSQYLQMVDKPYLLSYKFNVNRENLRTTNQFLENYITNIEPDMNYESVLTYREAFGETFNLIQIIGIGLAGLVGAVGVINFVMTMIYNVRSRQKELAMLESIGLLKRQQIKMLIWEGTFYTLFTIVLSIALSVLASILVSKYFIYVISYYEYSFTLLPFVIIILVLEIISILTAICCNKMNHSKSLLKRLNIDE